MSTLARLAAVAFALAVAAPVRAADERDLPGLFETDLNTKFILFPDGTVTHFDGWMGAWKFDAKAQVVTIDWAFNVTARLTMKDKDTFSAVGVDGEKKETKFSGKRLSEYHEHTSGVGTYEWFDGSQVRLALKKGKDATVREIVQNGQVAGEWSYRGQVYTLNWSGGYVDVLKLINDGNTLAGVGKNKDVKYPVVGLRRDK